MRKLALKISALSIFFYFIGAQKSIAQEGKFSLEQSPKFEQYLKEKKKINTNLTINDGYKIQIFHGNSTESKKHLMEFEKEFKDIKGTIVYSSPSYKVYVGPFKSRLHAEGALIDIKEKYPSALLIKP